MVLNIVEERKFLLPQIVYITCGCESSIVQQQEHKSVTNDFLCCARSPRQFWMLFNLGPHSHYVYVWLCAWMVCVHRVAEEMPIINLGLISPLSHKIAMWTTNLAILIHTNDKETHTNNITRRRTSLLAGMVIPSILSNNNNQAGQTINDRKNWI